MSNTRKASSPKVGRARKKCERYRMSGKRDRAKVRRIMRNVNTKRRAARGLSPIDVHEARAIWERDKKRGVRPQE